MGQPVLCEPCVGAAERNRPPVCQRCGVGLRGAFDAIAWCARCREAPPAFEAARAPWRYAGSIEDAVRQFKYRRRWRLGCWLAQGMASVARASLPLEEVSLIVPVPQHWLRRRLRGFHAAAWLAGAIGRALGKPVRPSALRQMRWTSTQTRLNGRARFRNVQGAFAAEERAVCGQTILLVDDVLTSGATAHACALALGTAAARRVFVLTAARTPYQER